MSVENPCAGMFDGGVPCRFKAGHDGLCEPAGSVAIEVPDAGDLTELEVRVLEAINARPGIKVGELAEDLDADVMDVAAALGVLGQAGRLTISRRA